MQRSLLRVAAAASPADDSRRFQTVFHLERRSKSTAITLSLETYYKSCHCYECSVGRSIGTFSVRKTTVTMQFISTISLGPDCGTKFQITRHQYSMQHPEQTGAGFRMSGARIETHIFDWQRTPLSAVYAYIECDFVGIFEREDIKINSDGYAYNQRFGVEHTHAFRFRKKLTESHIDSQYAKARKKIEYLADKFRRLLDHERGPVLYVIGRAPPAKEMNDLATALRKRAPMQQFHIAVISKDSEPTHNYSDEAISQFRVRDDPGESARFAWEGHDASWEAALRTFPIRPERVCTWHFPQLRQWMRYPRKTFKSVFLQSPRW